MNNSKTIKFTTLAVLATLGMSAQSFAASNAEECTTEISNAEQMMLTSNITMSQINEIDAELQKAKGLCDSGNFQDATNVIAKNVKTMQDASN